MPGSLPGLVPSPQILREMGQGNNPPWPGDIKEGSGSPWGEESAETAEFSSEILPALGTYAEAEGGAPSQMSEAEAERDCENTDEAIKKVYVDVLVDTVRRMSLLPSDMLNQKFRWGTAARVPQASPARSHPPPPGGGCTSFHTSIQCQATELALSRRRSCPQAPEAWRARKDFHHKSGG